MHTLQTLYKSSNLVLKNNSLYKMWQTPQEKNAFFTKQQKWVLSRFAMQVFHLLLNRNVQIEHRAKESWPWMTHHIIGSFIFLVPFSQKQILTRCFIPKVVNFLIMYMYVHTSHPRLSKILDLTGWRVPGFYD